MICYIQKSFSLSESINKKNIIWDKQAKHYDKDNTMIIKEKEKDNSENIMKNNACDLLLIYE